MSGQKQREMFGLSVSKRRGRPRDNGLKPGRAVSDCLPSDFPVRGRDLQGSFPSSSRSIGGDELPFRADCAPRGKARFPTQSAPTRRRSATTAKRRVRPSDRSGLDASSGRLVRIEANAGSAGKRRSAEIKRGCPGEVGEPPVRAQTLGLQHLACRSRNSWMPSRRPASNPPASSKATRESHARARSSTTSFASSPSRISAATTLATDQPEEAVSTERKI